MDSLPDAPRNGSVWRGAYLVPEAVARAGLWLEWESGERSALPTPAGLDQRAAPPGVPEPVAEPEPGGEVIDRAVLAERRARRAEAAEQAQARVASEALRALDALELRGTELEQRVEALAAERDALAEQARVLEQQVPRDEHQRRALADALAAAAAARRQTREWRLRMRAAEVARTSDAVRLRVLEAREASGAPLRAAQAKLAAALAAERGRARGADRSVAARPPAGDGGGRRPRRGPPRPRPAARGRRPLRRRMGGPGDRGGVRARARARRARGPRGRAVGRTRRARAGAAAVAELTAGLAAERAARAAAGADAEAARGEAASAGAALRAENVVRVALEDELERERAARNVLSDALDAETDALASLHVELNAERAARVAERSELEAARVAERDALEAARVSERSEHEAARSELEAARAAAQAELGAFRAAGPDPELQEELTRERGARQADQAALAALRDDLAAERAALVALQDELGAERHARAADQTALASLRDDLAAERAAREALRAESRRCARRSPRDTTAELRAEMQAARQVDHAVVARLRDDLAAERAAREADQAALASLRTELETAQARLTEAGAADEGGLLERVAGLADEIEFQRRAREQAEAAAAHVPGAGPGRVVADLDAAASALRERAANGIATPPTEPRPPRPPRPPAEAAPTDAAAAPAEDAPADTEDIPAAASPERTRREIVSARGGPARGHATGRSQRQYPWLRGALVKLAHDDPETAGRIIAGLLPVQAVIVQGPVDYDLTITEIGTFSVSVNSGRAYVNAIAEPRGRREADFHLSADALTLAELIAGVPHKLGRFRGPARVSGRKRRAKPLKTIRTAGLSLAEAARAGARLEPALVFRTFPYVVHPAWSRDQSFTVAQQILGDPPETWYLVVGNGGMRVLSTPPEEGADATVTMTREAFGQLLRGEPVPRRAAPVDPRRPRRRRAAEALAGPRPGTVSAIPPTVRARSLRRPVGPLCLDAL